MLLSLMLVLFGWQERGTSDIDADLKYALTRYERDREDAIRGFDAVYEAERKKLIESDQTVRVILKKLERLLDDRTRVIEGDEDAKGRELTLAAMDYKSAVKKAKTDYKKRVEKAAAAYLAQNQVEKASAALESYEAGIETWRPSAISITRSRSGGEGLESLERDPLLGQVDHVLKAFYDKVERANDDMLRAFDEARQALAKETGNINARIEKTKAINEQAEAFKLGPLLPTHPRLAPANKQYRSTVREILDWLENEVSEMTRDTLKAGHSARCREMYDKVDDQVNTLIAPSCLSDFAGKRPKSEKRKRSVEGASYRSQPRGLIARSQRTKQAIASGVAWLVANQDTDGSWNPEEHLGQSTVRVGITSLGALALIASGIEFGETEEGQALTRAIRWLEDQEGSEIDGLIGNTVGLHYMYGHALATQTLAAAVGLGRPESKGVLQRAIDFIAASRNPYRVWRYDHAPTGRDEENDMSVTGMMVMALGEASRVGAKVDAQAISAAEAYIDDMSDISTGRTGYLERGGYSSREEGDDASFLPKFPKR